MPWKYIMILIGGKKYPVIFPAFLHHNDVANGLSRTVFGFNGVLSAGFIEEVNVHYVHGESYALGISSAAEDENLIEKVNEEGN